MCLRPNSVNHTASFISHRIDSTIQSNHPVSVYPNGSVASIHRSVLTTSCTMNVRFFPFDTQNCTIKFGSWIYSNFEINLTIDTNQPLTIEYRENGVWHPQVSTRQTLLHKGTPYESTQIAIDFILSRGSFYYVLIIIIPCNLLALINLMVFLLPTESGEKVSLGITNYLALVLTQQLVGELIPPASDRLPIILCKL